MQTLLKDNLSIYISSKRVSSLRNKVSVDVSSQASSDQPYEL